MKNIIVLLIVLALVGGFVLIMRQQDIKKAQLAEKSKMEMEARRQAEKREREQLEEKRRLEEAKENERREKERQAALEKREEERKREAELKEYESTVRTMKMRISALKRKLIDLQNDDYASPEARRMTEEIAAIDRLLDDNTYKCFDFCIKFRNIEFQRVMRHSRESSDDQGYYYTGSTSEYYRNRKKGWRKVSVSYHCNVHNIDWTRKKAESYGRNYIPKNQLEIKRNSLRASLKKLAAAGRSQRAGEIAGVKAELAAAERDLAEFEAAHRPRSDK